MAPFGPAGIQPSSLKSILDCTNDALFLTEEDPRNPPAQRICFVNEAFTRLTGYAPEEAAGRPPTFLCTASNDPILLRQVRAAFERGAKATFLLMKERKDGSRFRAELTVDPIASEAGARRVAAIERVPAEHADGPAAGAAEERFQALVDNLAQAILVYRDGQPLFANRAYLDLFGFASAAEALREISPLMNLPLDDQAQAGGADAQGSPAPVRPVRCEALRTDGAPVRLKLWSHRIEWRGGPAVMLAIERDRQNAGTAAAARPAARPLQPPTGRSAAPEGLPLLREITDAIPVMLAHKTRDLRYSYVNKAYADWVGVPREQLIGRHVGEVRNEAHFQMMKGRRADVLSGNTVEYVTKCEVPGRGMCDLRTTLIPQRNASGEIEGYFSLTQDITDLKEIERALIQREQQLRLVMDSVPALISYRDRNLRYHYVNRPYHELYGVRREDMIGRHMTEFMDLERFRRLKPYIDRVLAGEHVRHTQVVDFPSLGKRKLYISFIPHENEHGHIVGFFSLSQEVILTEESGQESRADVPEKTLNLLVGGD